MSRIPKLSTSLDRGFRDSYNEGVDFIEQDLNKAVSDSSTALNKATTAETNASLAKTTADTVKAQFDEVTKASTIDPQVSQALIGADGKTYSNIGNRFDTVDALMAQITSLAKDGANDYEKLQNALNLNVTTKLTLERNKEYVIANALTLTKPISIDFNGATIKWADNVSLTSRFETLKIVGVSDIKIKGLKIDGNKENQSYSISSGSSIASGLRLEDVTNCIFEDVIIEELLGYGVMMYRSHGNHFKNVKILNNGVYRSHTWNDTYKDNNFGDGYYISNSNFNRIDGFEIGHDGSITDATSLRAGVVLVNGEHNTFLNGTIYNVSRLIHLENNNVDETIANNHFENITDKNIGDVDHAVILYAVGSDALKDNTFKNVYSMKSRKTRGDRITSVFITGSTQNVIKHSVSFEDCYFSEFVSVGCSHLILKHCKIKGFFEVEPVVGRVFTKIIECEFDNIYLEKTRGLELINCTINKADNIIRVRTSISSVKDYPKIKGCTFTFETITSFVLNVDVGYIENCIFENNGLDNSDKTYVSVSGAQVHLDTQAFLRTNENTFVNDGSMGSAYKFSAYINTMQTNDYKYGDDWSVNYREGDSFAKDQSLEVIA